MAALYSLIGREDLKLYHLSYCRNASAKLSRSLTYAMYRKNIVNFSSNTAGPQPAVNPKLSEQEKLSHLYGELYEEMVNSYQSDKFPVSEDFLSPSNGRSGVCLGAALHFISLYLQNSEKSVDVVSHQFSKCATKEAQITQIIYSAQNISTLLEEIEAISRNAKQELEETGSELKAKIDESERLAHEMANQLDKDKLASTLVDLHSEIQSRVDSITERVAYEKARIETERLTPLAALHHLSLGLQQIIHDEDCSPKNVPEAFISCLEKYRGGAYLIGLSGSEGSPAGHAIAIIKKNDGSSYIFDPNFGTLKYKSNEKFCAKLWDLTKKFYNKQGRCKMTVFNCQTTE